MFSTQSAIYFNEEVEHVPVLQLVKLMLSLSGQQRQPVMNFKQQPETSRESGLGHCTVSQLRAVIVTAGILTEINDIFIS